MSRRKVHSPESPAPLAIGDLAVDLVLAMPRLCPEIKTFTFLGYSPGLVLDERLKASGNASVKEKLRDWRRIRQQARMDIPLFDVIIASRFKPADFDSLIQDVLYHRPERHIQKTWTVSARRLTRARIEQMKQECGKRAGLALTSVVSVDGGRTAHLPLMDFRCNRSGGNLRKLVSLFSAPHTHLPGRGCILKTERSYHFYGLNVLTKPDWLRFLARCLLLGPLADSRYIAHCMLHGQSSLRITESPKHNDAPKVSAFVGN